MKKYIQPISYNEILKRAIEENLENLKEDVKKLKEILNFIKNLK